MKYFAYGSNMCTARLKKRVPSAKFLVVASLKGHDLKLNKKGKDGSGKCNIQRTNDTGKVVMGVVFEMDPNDKPALDRAEGLGHGYSEKNVKVSSQHEKREIEAFTYQAQDSFIDNALKPYDWYKEFVVAGGKEHTFPDSYVKRLERVEAVKDPDKCRAEKNRKILKSCNQDL
ncbi:MAG: gamma-glutamylcyclotransferase family protein [Nitrospinales bacterium]